jgi:hypothetical protein
MIVEYEYYPDKQICICRCPEKMVQSLTIKKDPSGYIFFDIVPDQGPTPSELSGKYSSIPKAKEAVEFYLRNKKETIAARRENFAKEREERKALKDAPKSNSESG